MKSRVSGIERRIVRLERDLGKSQAALPRTQVVIKEPHETEQEALERAGIDKDEPGTVIIVKFCSGESPIPAPAPRPKPEPQSIDEEIETIRSELHQEGYTDTQIDEMMAQIDEPVNDDTVAPKPLRCDELTKLFKL